jgi:hypothetical protein
MDFFIAQWANSTKWTLVAKIQDFYHIYPGKYRTVDAARQDAYTLGRRDGVQLGDINVTVVAGTSFMRQVREQKMGPTYERTTD